MLVELLCLLVFSLRLVHYARVVPPDKFWKDPKNICIIAIVTVGGASLHVSPGRSVVERSLRPGWEAPNPSVGSGPPAPPLQAQLVSTVTPGVCGSPLDRPPRPRLSVCPRLSNSNPTSCSFLFLLSLLS